ncbi:MAG TPA: pantoate--beta-alanine ligase [Bacteroidales bacterium]|jgi:pantoate--beta-alanine ligase|nr:pantoate--beta-alanine ligase [Bacteroidales bacterium]
MIICKNRTDLQSVITKIKAQGKSLGFVPTMGALHQGHISLIHQSVQTCDITCASIFVNPTQFNNPHDLQTYPRTLDSDIAMLNEAGCDIVFVPEVIDMYPQGTQHIESYNFGSLERVMEGAFRPGHFNGVAIIVKRLFDLIPADTAFFGLKDYQQVAIIRALVEQEKIPVRIVACPTVREPDGLAMSSRNMRLNAEQRKQAVEISKTLFTVQALVGKKSVDDVKKFVIDTLNSVPLLSVEYFEIVHQNTLQPIQNWNEPAVACVAVNVGDVRLIDNVLL